MRAHTHERPPPQTSVREKKKREVEECTPARARAGATPASRGEADDVRSGPPQRVPPMWRARGRLRRAPLRWLPVVPSIREGPQSPPPAWLAAGKPPPPRCRGWHGAVGACVRMPTRRSPLGDREQVQMPGVVVVVDLSVLVSRAACVSTRPRREVTQPGSVRISRTRSESGGVSRSYSGFSQHRRRRQ